MNNRSKTLYGKPKTLTDKYDECSDEAIALVLRKSESELNWNDFNMLFRAGVAPATYEEGLYFIPAAFVFLRRDGNNGALDCVADVIWFLSEHATLLEKDGLLNQCREQVLALLAERTRQFGASTSRSLGGRPSSHGSGSTGQSSTRSGGNWNRHGMLTGSIMWTWLTSRGRFTHRWRRLCISEGSDKALSTRDKNLRKLRTSEEGYTRDQKDKGEVVQDQDEFEAP